MGSAGNMVHTLTHTEIVGVPDDDLFDVSKQMDEILPVLEPEYFTKSVFLKGNAGEPGSIRLVKPGPAIPNVGEWKEKLDYFDVKTKSLRYEVLGGDPRYNNVATVIKCVPHGDTATKVIWTLTYEPVGDAPPPEFMKEGVIKVFKTLERAVMARKTLTHTETISGTPNAVWKAVQDLDRIIPKYLPHVFESSTKLPGEYYGVPGAIRILKFGPANPVGGSLWERLEYFNEETKTIVVSMLKGDPRYPYFKTRKIVRPGAVEGTSDAEWTVTYVAAPWAGPPESHKDMYMQVCRMIDTELKANPGLYDN